MKHIYLILILGLLAIPLCAQSNGDLQYIGDQAILQVWGNHFERGHAQGYLLGGPILDIFQYYYQNATNSDPDDYNYMWNYFQEHFDTDTRMLSEVQGMISGMQEAGTELYHTGLQRNLGAEDILLVNALADMQQMRNATSENDLEFGCASLASWGISTQQDSLLAGASVITRFWDWIRNSTLIANPLLVVHHPSESDEQKWMGFTYPGLIGPLSAINEANTWASLNNGNNHTATHYQGLDPILFDLRRGIEQLDFNSDGSSDALDLIASIGGGLHLMGAIIHTLSENSAGLIPVVIETNNSGTVTRYYDQNGNLPGNHLAATNHFRQLISPTWCTRYAHIQDSLNVDHNISAERQWRVLSGAAGVSFNLTALQFIPSTGQILWASATAALPAYQAPAISLSVPVLFNFSTPVADENIPAAQFSFSCHPNPLPANTALKLQSTQPLQICVLHNIRGQKVFERDLSGKTEVEISFAHLPAGVYLLSLESRSGIRSQRKLQISP